MLIPKGNILIENTELSYSDLNLMLGNLEQDGFTGYVKVGLQDTIGLVFYVEGALVRALEMNPASGSNDVHMLSRLLTRMKGRDLIVSCYVMSDRIVQVLSGLFAFQTLYLDYEVKKRELKKVLSNLEAGEHSGFLRVTSQLGVQYLLFQAGEIVTDRFSWQYGEVLCGDRAVGELLDTVNKTGATVSVHAEKASEVELRRQERERELEKIKQVTAIKDAGFFRAGDVVKVDEYVVREWGQDVKSVFNVEIETPDGQLYEYKCQVAKRMGSNAGLAPAMLKKMGLREGDVLSIRPL